VVKERIDYCGVAAGRNLLLLVCTEQRQTLPDILGSSFHGFAVAQWLRCCATNWKIVGSIPDGVIGIFH